MSSTKNHLCKIFIFFYLHLINRIALERTITPWWDNLLGDYLLITFFSKTFLQAIEIYISLRRRRPFFSLHFQYFECPPLNPFSNKPWILRVCCTGLLKTLWEKEKLLVTSNFSFSHSVFYPFWEFSVIFVNLKLLSAKSFSLEESKICRLGKGWL